MALDISDPAVQRLVLLAIVIVAVLLTGGLWRNLQQRRRRASFAAPVAPSTAGGDYDAQGERATFVVVGTRDCSDCARTLAALRAEFAHTDGVQVEHVLAERAPALVDRFNIQTAPTVLLLDANSSVVGVHPGAVDTDVARVALDRLEAGDTPFVATSDPRGAQQ